MRAIMATALLIVASMSTAPPATAAKSCHMQLFIFKNGDVSVDGTRYADRARLKLRLRRLPADCTAAVKAEDGASYDAVVYVLAQMQRNGDTKIGFANGSFGN